MVQKRRPLEFSDPYDETIPGGAGGHTWMQRNLPPPPKEFKRTRNHELKELDKLMLEMGKCPGCGSISGDYAGIGICPECGYQE